MELERRIARAREVYALLVATDDALVLPHKTEPGTRALATRGETWAVAPGLLEPWRTVVLEAIAEAGTTASPAALREALVLRLATAGVIWRTGERVVSSATALKLPAGHPMATAPGTIVSAADAGREEPPVGGYYVKFDRLAYPMAVFGTMLEPYTAPATAKKKARKRLQAAEG